MYVKNDLNMVSLVYTFETTSSALPSAVTAGDIHPNALVSLFITTSEYSVTPSIVLSSNRHLYAVVSYILALSSPEIFNNVPPSINPLLG